MVTHTYVTLEIDEARKLASLNGIEYDLSSTIEWCNEYPSIESLNSIIYPDIFTTAILIRFMRAFGGGIRRESAAHLLSALNTEQKSNYEYFQNIRDKHVAHSVNEFEENYVNAYYIEERPEDGVNSISSGGGRVVGLSSLDIERIKSICQTLLIAVNAEIQTEKEKLLVIAKIFTTEDILKMDSATPKHINEMDVSKRRK